MEYRKLSDIKLLENNPRRIDEKQFKILCKSIKENSDYFEARPIILSDRTGELIIIAGNQRYKAAEHLKLKEVPTFLIRGLSEEKEKEIVIRDNISNGSWDFDILSSETWGTVEELAEWGLDIPNFEIDEVLEAEEDDFDVPEGGIETDIVLGDLFEIGEHRLLCGDSTDSEQVARLMNGEKADMVFTDPPYGIKVVKSEMVGANFGIAKKGKYSEVIADDTTETAKEFYDTCVSLGMNDFIIWGGNYFTDFLPFSDGWLVWNKRAGTDIRNTFADGEMAWCSFHTPIRIYDQLWNGMIREGEKDKRVHPTQKPIRMLSEIITDHIKGNLIFDGFLGSGSILVASHQLNVITNSYDTAS